MRKFIILLKCEETRMLKYGITYASLGVTLIWVILIQMVEMNEIGSFFPLFIFADATLMSFLLVGVGMMYEKQENTLKSMLVTPIGKHIYLLSKISSTVISSLTTLVLLGAYGMIFKSMSVNIPGIIGAVVLSSFVFACIGILFTYRSKDFTVLLMWLMAFAIVLAVPTLLNAFEIIQGDWFQYVQYTNPTQSALILLSAPLMEVERKELLFSVCYMAVMAGALYLLAAHYFDRYSMKEFGGE